jgi:5-methylcytosine-specific restriction endonuclease McrA
MAVKPCRMCDRDFTPRQRTQEFCSRSCAALYQHAVNPRPRKPGARKWSAKTPEQKAIYQSREYRQARERLVTAALGKPCPGCGRMVTAANAQVDHVTARALGGGSTAANLRVLCGPCNHKRGSSLGGRVTAARRSGMVARRNVGGRNVSGRGSGA